MNINWLFIVALFVMTLGFIGLGVLLFVMAGTGTGIIFGVISSAAGVGSLIGGIYLTKSTLNAPSAGSTESVNPAK